MSSDVTRALCGFLLISLVVWSERASAFRSRQVILDYHADPACPDRQTFFQYVRARVHDLELSTTDDSGVRYVVTFDRYGEKFVGDLRIVEAGGSSTIRELTDTTCEALVSAFALVLAIELGSENAHEPSPTQDVPALVPSMPPPPRVRRLGSPGKTVRPHGYAVVSGALTSGLASALSPEVQAGVELRLAGAPAWLGRPALRVTGLFGSGREILGSDGSGQLTVLSTALRACAFSVPGLRSDTVIEPCVTGELGALRTKGTTARDAQVASRPWSSAGALVQFVWWPLARLYVGAELGLVVPVTRYRTYLATPEVVLFTVPPMIYRWSLGVGLRFL